jgi:hypothetical protein
MIPRVKSHTKNHMAGWCGASCPRQAKIVKESGWDEQAGKIEIKGRKMP